MNALDKAFADADRLREISAKAASSSAMALASGGTGVVSTIPGLADARQLYQHGSRGWAFVAARAIATRLAGQQIFIGRSGKPKAGRKFAAGLLPEPMTSHPFLDALDSPNPLSTRWQLIYNVGMSLELAGSAFLWWSDNEIYYLPSHWVRPADNLRSGWIIRPPRQAAEFTVPGESICFISLPDPSDPFDTLSPLKSQANAISIDEAIQTAQNRSFKNGCFPQLLIKAGRLPGMLPGDDGEKPILTPEQRLELITAIRAIYRGASNFGEPLIVDGLISGVETLSQSPSEMDYLNSGAAVRSRILRAYGVSDAVLGELENSNRAAAFVAEQSFCQNVLNPLGELISQCLTKWARSQFNDSSLTVWLDWFEANDSEMELQRWQLATNYGWVSQNEYRRQLLNLPPVEGGDVYRNPLSLTELGASDDDSGY